jgi:hypothetical protein
MKMPSFSAVMLALSSAYLSGQTTDDQAAAPLSFSIISPQAAAALKDDVATPEGQGIIKAAEAALSRPSHPLPRVHLEGTLPHQGIWDQSIPAMRDWVHMQDFGFAYRLTGDHRYLQAEEQYLSAWLGIYKVSLNPIDETGMDDFLVSYDLTRADLPQALQDQMSAFLRAMATGYLDIIAKQIAAGKEDIGNWQNHRVKLITLSAFALGDEGLIERAHQAYLEQLSVNISPTGMVHDFLERDALHYVTYDLDPLVVSALAAKAHGQDWFDAHASSGASLPLALDWLTPFALGQKTHEEFVHSKVAFDAARAHVGMTGYTGMWVPSTSLPLYEMAAILDPKYGTVFQQVNQNTGNKYHPLDWLVLVTKTGL